MSYIQDLIGQIEDTAHKIIEEFAPASASSRKPLAASEPYGADPEQHNFTGSTRVHGIDVPNQVLHQLKERGIMLETYSAQEVQMAIQACAIDNTLIDDHNGVGFHDQLHKDSWETHEENNGHDEDRLLYRKHGGQIQSPNSKPESSWLERVGKKITPDLGFCHMVEESRDKAQHQTNTPD